MEAAVEVTAPVEEAVAMAPVVEVTEAVATEVRVAKPNQTTVQEHCLHIVNAYRIADLHEQ